MLIFTCVNMLNMWDRTASTLPISGFIANYPSVPVIGSLVILPHTFHETSSTLVTASISFLKALNSVPANVIPFFIQLVMYSFATCNISGTMSYNLYLHQKWGRRYIRYSLTAESCKTSLMIRRFFVIPLKSFFTVFALVFFLICFNTPSEPTLISTE